MLLNQGELNGARVLSPNTVKLMTSDHLGDSINNKLAGTEPGRVGYGFGLGVAVEESSRCRRNEWKHWGLYMEWR
jgi:hypothetical protein